MNIPRSTFPSSLLLGCVLVTMLLGCGNSDQHMSSDIAYDMEKRYPESANSYASTDAETIEPNLTAEIIDDSEAMEKAGATLPSQVSRTTRKIIYNANVRLVVADFDPVESAIRKLVVKHDGFLANSDVDAQRGEYRYGNWTVRVPVENYNTFLEELALLGSITSRSENAQDVTEEFVDLRARISNKEKLETRIIELLKDRDDKIQNVLAVEQELARVREEIERMQGRITYLSDRTSLATITINAVQERDYKPVEALTFGERISATWSDSMGALATFGKGMLIFVVAVAPWLIAFMILAIPVYYLLRAFIRRLFRRPVASA